jgi:hypothetical protein
VNAASSAPAAEAPDQKNAPGRFFLFVVDRFIKIGKYINADVGMLPRRL